MRAIERALTRASVRHAIVEAGDLDERLSFLDARIDVTSDRRAFFERSEGARVLSLRGERDAEQAQATRFEQTRAGCARTFDRGARARGGYVVLSLGDPHFEAWT